MGKTVYYVVYDFVPGDPSGGCDEFSDFGDAVVWASELNERSGGKWGYVRIIQGHELAPPQFTRILGKE